MTELETPQTPSLHPDFTSFSTFISEKLESFALDDKDARNVALTAAKAAFQLALTDEQSGTSCVSNLLSSLSRPQPPQTRFQARAIAEGKPPPDVSVRASILKPTPLSSLHVANMDEAQIWAQMELKLKNVSETLDDIFENEVEDPILGQLGDEDLMEDLEGFEGMDLDDEDGEPGFEFGSDDDEEEEEGDDEHDDDGDEEWAGEGEGNLGESVMELREESSSSEEEEEEGDDDEDANKIDLDRRPEPASAMKKSSRTRKRGHPELDDDFFNLADFNAEVEEAEALNVSKGSLSKDADDSEEDNEDTVDLYAPVDDFEAFDEEDMDDATEPTYQDFFDPPSQPGKYKTTSTDKDPDRTTKVRFHGEVKVKNIKAKGKSRPTALLKKGIMDDDDDLVNASDILDMEEDNEDEGGEGVASLPDDPEESSEDGDAGEDNRGTIERLTNDLFAEEDEAATDLSTHEMRMKNLQKQIQELEAENVSDKHWTLKGETSANARPTNALLEEVLSFDHVQKSTPVVTEEAIQSLEARIKQRIVDGIFDDVVRKTPIKEKDYVPSRTFELQHTKSNQSLMQVYENEYMNAKTGGYTGQEKDIKLQKEHAEIEAQWESICYKLDSLCNAHFTPKPPPAVVSTVPNVATISLESVMPSTHSSAEVMTASTKEIANARKRRRVKGNSQKRLDAAHGKTRETARGRKDIKQHTKRTKT